MGMVAYSFLEATSILRVVEVAGLQLIILLGEVSLFDAEGPGPHSGWLLGRFWSRVQGSWVGQGAREPGIRSRTLSGAHYSCLVDVTHGSKLSVWKRWGGIKVHQKVTYSSASHHLR